MIEYFNNKPFLETIPSFGNQQCNSTPNPIIYIVLAVGAGVIVGCLLQHAINKKKMALIINENDELRKKSY